MEQSSLPKEQVNMRHKKSFIKRNVWLFPDDVLHQLPESANHAEVDFRLQVRARGGEGRQQDISSRKWRYRLRPVEEFHFHIRSRDSDEFRTRRSFRKRVRKFELFDRNFDRKWLPVRRKVSEKQDLPFEIEKILKRDPNLRPFQELKFILKPRRFIYTISLAVRFYIAFFLIYISLPCPNVSTNIACPNTLKCQIRITGQSYPMGCENAF